MNIKVIGSGCENCDKTNAIVAELFSGFNAST